jgi:hypothetical protein
MANEFVARNGIIALDNSRITGSLNVSGGITGSLFGTASFTTSASFATTSSLATTASLALSIIGGAINELAFFGSPSNITSSATLTYNPTSSFLISNSITASGGTARGVNLTPTLAVTASSDNLVGLDINNSFRGGIATGPTSAQITTSGSGYVSSTYTNVPLTGGTGTGALATIIVSGGSVTTTTVSTSGTGYTAGDVLSASNTNLGGSGSGFTTTVRTLVNTPRLIGIRVDDISIGRGGGYQANNTAIGTNALRVNSTGDSNTAIGANALSANTTGSANTAVGFQALGSNTAGANNTAVGSQALRSGGLSITSVGNTAIGTNALAASSGADNTAVGYFALSSSLNTSNNTAVGRGALGFNTGGSNNVAIGQGAIGSTGVGANNVAIGQGAMGAVGGGSNNTVIGQLSMNQLTSGNNNIALGWQAGRYISTGTTANSTSTNSLYIGYDIRASANGNTNEVVIAGYNGTAGTIGLGSNTTSIGNSSTTGTFLYGRTILGSTTDNGTDRLQVSGSTLLVGNTVVRPASGSNALFQVNGTALRINYLNDALSVNISSEHRATDFTWQNNLGQSVLTLNSSGNLLLGTTTADGSRLQVNGNQTISGTLGVTGAATLSAYSFADSALQFRREATNTVSPASGNGILVFASGNAQMRMDTSNAINFDMNNSGSPHTALILRQNGNTVIVNSPNNSLPLGLAFGGTIHGYMGAAFSALYAYSNNGGYVLLNASSVWVAASDTKRKRNLENYNLGLNAILGLQPKLYNMDFQKDGDEKQVGLIAQSVREHIPLAYEENDKFIGLNYNAIIVTMVNAIKELKAEIEELKTK